MSDVKRKQLFVDANVQGALIRRMVGYWVACLGFMTVPIFIGKVFQNPDRYFYEMVGEVWGQYWPMLVAAAAILPFVLYDVLKVSNRFAGPVYRLRRELGRLADGEEVDSIHFREGDFWQDLADSFNQVNRRIAESHSVEPSVATKVESKAEEETVVA